VPVTLGYDGFVRRVDTGASDDLTSGGTGGTAINDRLQGRKMVFGDPFRQKRARVARVRFEAEQEQTPSIRIVGDSASGAAHTVTVSGGVGIVEKKIRTNLRDEEFRVEVSGAGAGTKISGLAIGAELLREIP
jgi:hypothetical protein